jgi:hypothetical protein
MAGEEYSGLLAAAETAFGRFLHKLAEETDLAHTSRPLTSIAKHYAADYLKVREEAKEGFLNHFTQSHVPGAAPQEQADSAARRAYEAAQKKVATDIATDDGGKLYPALQKKLARRLSAISVLLEHEEVSLYEKSRGIAKAILDKGKDKGPPGR